MNRVNQYNRIKADLAKFWSQGWVIGASRHSADNEPYVAIMRAGETPEEVADEAAEFLNRLHNDLPCLLEDAEFWEQEFREVEAINAKHLGVNIADLREDAAWCPECDGDLYIQRGSSAYCLKCRTMWETEADEIWNPDTGDEIHSFRAVKKLLTPIEKQMQELRWMAMGDDL